MRMRVPAVPARDTGRTAGSEGDASDNALGEYLRRCRARLDPSSAGLPVVAPDRRVEGLRREEISFLTGVSADYYGRLEQGRERNPSVRVVEALSRALQLDPDGRGRLYRLSGINPSLGPDSMPARVHPALLRLLEDSSPAVAYALSPCLDVLAVSRRAQALLSPLGSESNLVRALFTHPKARAFFAEWPLAAAATVHTLRRNALRCPDDIDITDLVAEMSARSADFNGMWESGKEADLHRAYGTVVHPDAGRVELTYTSFSRPAAPGQLLLVGAPSAGSRSAQALTYLTAMSALPRGPLPRHA
ncbi:MULTISPECIES: helix-turn-helix domain-containing protein [Streptomyces]|uniref:Helix-turn-helix transcriptional regulator n=1 Tax=Streptomyces glycanivorans TaxID=3033808 RepID=A0ABY9JEU8_9ACTN|nr:MULTISPECIES: helix-turn-helix transcriptional regulator [unclassified Streptomyces]WSQ78332.1 helix-turn-helix transcriptional regulator [Streptomyces sp. NBC_01213]TXS12724.1 XRE family transcriptional regulator [Streptomyces sp. wa22]WLQ64949.1 helix-turn-helix transcriptional regulator [Streptomyces sp. Alt3]WSQ85704.1 helix-turn-helix transcriptional regulator [Streptomyces sp. NBC_01212]WSR08203.1 helix-turn-helix transcriptional regulator [Streptomyces sp. NBC_01208]